jgi:ribosomal protein L21E
MGTRCHSESSAGLAAQTEDFFDMKKLKTLPEPLQKQILLWLGMSAALMILGLVSAVLLRDKNVLLIFVVAIFCAVQGVRIGLRPYSSISGTVSEVQTTPIRRRSKAILLKTMQDGQVIVLRVPLRQGIQKFAVGDALDIYVDVAAKIYDWNNEFRLQSYIAIDKRSKP